MDVMILAAGRGLRLRPLTDETPKPLLMAGDCSLIEHHLEALAKAGVTRIVINHAHLGEQITARLEDGSRYGLQIQYSDESSGALETGGGIRNALPLLQSDPFAVVNSDIWTDFAFSDLPVKIKGLAHLVLVNNPSHRPGGDFMLSAEGIVNATKGVALTFSGIGVYHHRLFEDCSRQHFPLAPLLLDAAAQGQVSGVHYPGEWVDVGTPERLRALDRRLKNLKLPRLKPGSTD